MSATMPVNARPAYWTLEEAAREVGCCVETVKRGARRGEFEACKNAQGRLRVGRCVDAASFMRWWRTGSGAR